MPITKKHHIKYLYVRKDTRRTAILDICLLTDDFQYVDFDFAFNLNVITESLSNRIRAVFADFRLDKKSQVVVSPLVSDHRNPFYMYLMFLREHIEFNMNKADDDIVVRRIAALHTSYLKTKQHSKINKSMFNKLWKKLLETERCPWISKQVEYDLQMKSLAYAKRKRHCRMALYYMAVREYLMGIKRRSDERLSNI